LLKEGKANLGCMLSEKAHALVSIPMNLQESYFEKYKSSKVPFML
jgi:hypothetical protein